MSPARSTVPDPPGTAPRRHEELLARLVDQVGASPRGDHGPDGSHATHSTDTDTQKGPGADAGPDPAEPDPDGDSGRGGTGAGRSPIVHVRRLSPRAPRHAPWPAWVPEQLRRNLAELGAATGWCHQVAVAEHARAGRSVVVATGTASGKSLAYQVPVLSTLLDHPRGTALYLAPTKALAAEQVASARALAPPSLRIGPYDGDTPPAEREWSRNHAQWLFSNPDMLSRGILPDHRRWGRFLRQLRAVVVDECHSYRGVFGSHVALVLRRLRRLCAHYGTDPVFILASATVANPAELAQRLVGVPVAAVTEDASPRPAVTFTLWEPPPLPGEAEVPRRRPAQQETARILAELVASGVQTLAFVRSRRGAETVAIATQRLLAQVAPGLPERVAAYRGGFLAEERRGLEARLARGELLGVATTNALELGVDIAGLDAVVLCGFPGTHASLWQQAGRAGRGGSEALVLFVARDDPLDAYLVHHPRALFGRPLEATVLDPANPHVLAPHLCAAAAELPVTEEDLPLLGGDAAVTALAGLVHRRQLRRRPTGWFWTSSTRPRVELRGEGGEPVHLVEAGTGRLLGTVDRWSATTTAHPGALYLHQGVSYLVEELDLDGGAALMRPVTVDWHTTARDLAELRVVSIERQRHAGAVLVEFGAVDVTNQVVSFLRRRTATGEVLAEVPLELPPRQLRTQAVWYTASAATLAEAGVPGERIPGAVHAAEHAAIGLLPLVASCDRWDIGGVSTAAHPDTGGCSVFVYDGHPGGAGFAARGFDALGTWLAATRDVIRDCPCEAGCPSCIHSPKCGNGNHPLDKAGALAVLELVLAATAER